MSEKNKHKLARAKILNQLDVELSYHLSYHSLEHTEDVMFWCEELAKKDGLAKDQLEPLLTAAAYHDAGFLISHKEHEALGCKLATSQLAALNFSADEIAYICSLIMSTKIPQSPFDHASLILCDADLAYLGGDNYANIAHQLYRELQHLQGSIAQAKWLEIQIKFLENHRFHTHTARETFLDQKLKTLEQLLEEQARYQ